MLEVRNLRICFDRVIAIHALDLTVHQGEIVAIIGPNGAGKTSTMMAISGIIQPKAGKILFDGHDITRTPSHEVYRRGIVQVPEDRLIFEQLTVRDNLLLGGQVHKDTHGSNSVLKDIFGLFPILRERVNERADTLSGGQLQMLAIARGLMGRPKLLMLDEPSLGLAPLIVEELFNLVRALNEGGTTILLVEQNVRKALEIADRACLLEAGKLVATGTAAELLHSDLILRSYLGTIPRSADQSTTVNTT